MTDRSFTDEELALIIRRAARAHATEPESRHSLEDVQQIAAQVGLPPELVAAIAKDLPGETAGGLIGKVFGPLGHFVATKRIERRVTPADYPNLLRLIRSELKTPGQVAQVGPTLEWGLGESHGQSVGSMILSIAPDSAGTRLRIEADLLPMRRNAYVALMLLGAVLGLIGSAELGAATVIVVASTISGLLAGWALTRTIWPRVVRGSEARADRLLHKVAAHLAQTHEGDDS